MSRESKLSSFGTAENGVVAVILANDGEESLIGPEDEETDSWVRLIDLFKERHEIFNTGKESKESLISRNRAGKLVAIRRFIRISRRYRRAVSMV